MRISHPLENEKTNPIKPNFIRHSLREGGFKGKKNADAFDD